MPIIYIYVSVYSNGGDEMTRGETTRGWNNKIPPYVGNAWNGGKVSPTHFHFQQSSPCHESSLLLFICYKEITFSVPCDDTKYTCLIYLEIFQNQEFVHALICFCFPYNPFLFSQLKSLDRVEVSHNKIIRTEIVCSTRWTYTFL